MPGSVTALAKLGLGDADPVDQAMNFAEFDPSVLRELKNTNGTRGSLFQDGNRMLADRKIINPTFTSEPTSTEIGYLLKWIMSGTPTGTTTKTYPWSDTPAAKFAYFRPNAGEQWFLSGCAVDTATFRATSGNALSIDLQLLAQDYDSTRTNFPALTYDTTLQPFLLSHLILTVGGVARKCREFSLVVDSMLDKTRYLNSFTLTALQKLGSSFKFTIDVPSGDQETGFWSSGIAGAAASAVFTNPTSSKILTFTLPDLRFPPRSPTHARESEGFLRIEAEAMRVGQTASDYPLTVSLTV